MNHSYVSYNNQYVVSDEKGNMKIINMDNSNVKAQEIFETENKLESLHQELDNCKKMYDFNSKDIIAARIINSTIYLGTFIMYLAVSPVMPIMGTVAIMGVFYFFTKLLSIACFGTRIGRKKKKKDLSFKISYLEDEIPALNYKLSTMKEKSHYDDNTYEVSSNTDSDERESNYCEVLEKPKVYRLSKDNK